MSSDAAIAIATDADRAALEDYLATRSDSCMLLRANLRAVGLAWTPPAGARLQAQYAIARRGGAVIGVAGHCWNGNVLVQADAHAGELAVAAVRHSGRRVSGLLGLREPVAAARAALGLDGAPTIGDHAETLMALPLDELVIPPALRDGAVIARRAALRDRDLLIAWRVAYSEESELAVGPGAEAYAAAAIDSALAAPAPRLWLVEHAGAPVAMCAHPAVLPEAVQVGGVFTPPALRSRGHARAVVAASLIDARAAGARRAILFTPRPDAIAAYRAVGFSPIGHYALVVFAA
jgi:GNAT superfamily N-acetyltransferase